MKIVSLDPHKSGLECGILTNVYDYQDKEKKRSLPSCKNSVYQNRKPEISFNKVYVLC